MTEMLRLPGKIFLTLIHYFGQLGILTGEILRSLWFGHTSWRQVLQQIVAIGYGSQPVVIVTGAFTGAVLAAQSFFKFKEFGIESSVGGIVSVAMCRELAPVLCGLMVAGRVGAAMAAEIGTMKVSEQLDALRVLDVPPVDYLVKPRLFAMMLSMPLLIAESITFGILASWVVISGLFHVPSAWFITHLLDHTDAWDVFIGMIKGFVFGLWIVLISCHQGLIASNGASGVGRGTTRAVVYSSLIILICNFFLTFLMNYFFPLGSGL